LPTVYNAVIGDHVDPTWDSPEAGDATPFFADDHTHLNQAGHDLTAEALSSLGVD